MRLCTDCYQLHSRPSDTCGYGGVITVLLFKDSLAEAMAPLDFFRYFTYFMSALGTVIMLVSAFYFIRKAKKAPPAHDVPDAPESA